MSTTKFNIKIDWSEIDLYGHVNNVAVMKYVQAARINFCEKIGINRLFAEEKKGFMVAATSCQYKRPLFFPGEVNVETQVDFIKSSSFSLNHQIYDTFGNLATQAQDILVMYDFNVFNKIDIPSIIKLKMKE